MKKKIFITGGAGYVGCALADYLVEKGYAVTVFDLFIYGENVFEKKNDIKIIKGDIRDKKLLEESIKNHDIVIHLACISNDPSFDLNPSLGKSINLDAFEPLVKISKNLNVERFIYASSSSVYGIKDMKDVHEDIPLDPITDYSKFKAQCEEILMKYKDENFTTVVIRPATVCGYSKRQRLDLIVNILSNLGYHKKEISVFGGEQLRPNIHIKDMIRSYKYLIEADKKLVNGEIFNAGWENLSVSKIANVVKSELGDDIKLVVTPTDDNRSYHISSKKIRNKINFITKYTINDAVKDLKLAFEKKVFKDSLNNPDFFNIKKMQEINLK
ncbi:NAD-dependent epimerase/dehydratase family protein [Candidatus Pelagibacter sp.]|uniref:NAD-dependent epimerase/dehydratase family protein n=1 Tax=Candidatus Pelagibacter sp. TaxID=2024849 RepID=UPI003F85FE54